MSLYERSTGLKNRKGALIEFAIKDIVGVETGDLQTAIVNALERGDVLLLHYVEDEETCYIAAVEDEDDGEAA